MLLNFTDMLLGILLCSTLHLACGFCGFESDCYLQGSTTCNVYDEHATRFVCKREGLTALPTSINLPPGYKQLTFQSNQVRSLKMGTFLKADGVEELDFSDNNIARIDNDTFAPFVSLRILQLNHNKLSKVNPGMLNGLRNLKVLDLRHNSIESISPLSFRETSNLQELRLSFNPLFQLPEDLFRFLPDLEKLDLEDTGLVELPDRIFAPVPRLCWLSLARNMFKNVPEKALAYASHLQNLDLSENDFTVLLKGAFKRLSHLTLLYLNNLHQLTWIEEGAFAGLVKLKFLSCSYNSKLNYIDKYVFGIKSPNKSPFKTPRIQKLYLRRNALSTFKLPIDVESLSSLSLVDLSENPWKCDCNLKWMMQLSKETQTSIRCYNPRHLRGRTFDTLDPSELICEEDWIITKSTLIVTYIGAFVVLIVVLSAVMCTKTHPGLYKSVKQKFSYDKVNTKAEVVKVDLEWDPSADM